VKSFYLSVVLFLIGTSTNAGDRCKFYLDVFVNGVQVPIGHNDTLTIFMDDVLGMSFTTDGGPDCPEQGGPPINNVKWRSHPIDIAFTDQNMMELGYGQSMESTVAIGFVCLYYHVL
jgi:hypothetical protein